MFLNNIKSKYKQKPSLHLIVQGRIFCYVFCMNETIFYIGDSYDNEIFAPQFFPIANNGDPKKKGMTPDVAVHQFEPKKQVCRRLYSAGDFHSNR